MGCTTLFLLPFAAVGILTGVMAVRAALAHEWEQAIGLGFFSLTFGLVGFGGIAGAFAGKRRMAAEQTLRDTHAGAPWMWRPDWATGRVEDSTRATATFVLIFALLWNLISLPAAYLAIRQALQTQKTSALLVLLFPAVGAALFVWALRATLRYRRYGVSRFELSTLPGVIGHSLVGTVRLSEVLRPEAGFQVALTCVRRRTSGSGRNRSTSETILWQEERTVPASGAVIPLAFAIPADGLPSDESDPSDRRIWRLRVEASVPGVDYSSTFEVPVFRTAESDRPRTPEEEQATRDPAVPAVYRQPPTSRIEVTTNRRGTEIYYPAARNPGLAAGITGFTLIWCTAIWATIHFGAPILFPILFGLFGILLVILTLDAWLRVTRVIVEPGQVSVASGYLTPGATTTVTAVEITDVTPRITMQGGSTPYYDVTITRNDGKKLSAGAGLRDKHEADWLTRLIREGLAG